jgi:hypothetical protein
MSAIASIHIDGRYVFVNHPAINCPLLRLAVKTRPMPRSSTPVKLLAWFAVCSYLWTVLLYFAPHTWHPAPLLVFLLCPACLLTVTVDPSLLTVVVLLAPINALVYGLVGLALGKIFGQSAQS